MIPLKALRVYARVFVLMLLVHVSAVCCGVFAGELPWALPDGAHWYAVEVARGFDSAVRTVDEGTGLSATYARGIGQGRELQFGYTHTRWDAGAVGADQYGSAMRLGLKQQVSIAYGSLPAAAIRVWIRQPDDTAAFATMPEDSYGRELGLGVTCGRTSALRDLLSAYWTCSVAYREVCGAQGNVVAGSVEWGLNPENGSWAFATGVQVMDRQGHSFQPRRGPWLLSELVRAGFTRADVFCSGSVALGSFGYLESRISARIGPDNDPGPEVLASVGFVRDL